MRISKSSWHYRLIAGHDRQATNLCQYVWRVVERLIYLFAVVMGVLAAIFGVCFSAGVIVWFVWKLTSLHPRPAVVLAIGLPLAFAVYRLGRHIIRRYFYGIRPSGESTPSLLLAYLRAKKQSICPLVEYVD